MTEKPPANPPKPSGLVLSVPKGRINWEALDEETAKKLRHESGFRRDDINRRKVKV